MANLLEPEDIKWKFRTSLAMDTYHQTLYRNDEYGLQMEAIVNRSKATGQFGKSKTYYYIDDCEKEMTDLQDLCNTWNELKNFDDPNNEIIWEKRIIPTIKLREGKNI